MRARPAWPQLLSALRRAAPDAERSGPRSGAAIGSAYDRTRRTEPEIQRQLEALLSLRSPGRILDLACGTGNYGAALARAGFRVVGVDRSAGMLAATAGKASGFSCCRSEAERLPFAPGSFEGAVCVSALHRFEDLAAILGECYRVLSGGRLVIFTALRQQMRGYWLNRYFPDTLERAIAQMPDQGTLEAALAAAGFALETLEAWEVPERPRDLFLYAGKHCPGLYLDRRVRSGISAFAELAPPGETVAGIKKLSADIASGRIRRVMEEFRHGLGDYCFLVAAKQESGADSPAKPSA